MLCFCTFTLSQCSGLDSSPAQMQDRKADDGEEKTLHVSINSISRPHQDWISQLMLTLSNDALAIHGWRA